MRTRFLHFLATFLDFVGYQIAASLCMVLSWFSSFFPACFHVTGNESSDVVLGVGMSTSFIIFMVISSKLHNPTAGKSPERQPREIPLPTQYPCVYLFQYSPRLVIDGRVDEALQDQLVAGLEDLGGGHAQLARDLVHVQPLVVLRRVLQELVHFARYGRHARGKLLAAVAVGPGPVAVDE
jgi:hypothetical protein